MVTMKNVTRIIVAIACIFCLSSPSRAVIDSLSVKPIDPEAGEVSIYQVSFVLSDTLPSDAVIIVTFPEGFDLSRVKVAGSSTINGGFKVSVDGQRVAIKRSGLGRPIPPGESVDVKFANVINPAREGKYAITVEILGDVKEVIAAIIKKE